MGLGNQKMATVRNGGFLCILLLMGKRSCTGEAAPNVGFIPVSRPFWSIPSGAGFLHQPCVLREKPPETITYNMLVSRW